MDIFYLFFRTFYFFSDTFGLIGKFISSLPFNFLPFGPFYVLRS